MAGFFRTLGLELTPDYHERTVFQSMLIYFSPMALILAQWLFPLSKADFWGDPDAIHPNPQPSRGKPAPYEKESPARYGYENSLPAPFRRPFLP